MSHSSYLKKEKTVGNADEGLDVESSDGRYSEQNVNIVRVFVLSFNVTATASNFVFKGTRATVLCSIGDLVEVSSTSNVTPIGPIQSFVALSN